MSELTDGFFNDKVGLDRVRGRCFHAAADHFGLCLRQDVLVLINPSMVSTQGTAIGAAINLAARSFTPSETIGQGDYPDHRW